MRGQQFGSELNAALRNSKGCDGVLAPWVSKEWSIVKSEAEEGVPEGHTAPIVGYRWYSELFRWLRLTGTSMRAAEQMVAEPISKVELDGRGSMTIGSRSYRIRDLQSIELRHSLEKGHWNVVDVYVGSTDHSGRNAFSQIALKRERVGTVDSTSDVAQQIRDKAAVIDLPILEY